MPIVYPIEPPAFSRVRSLDVSSVSNFDPLGTLTQNVAYAPASSKYQFIGQAIHEQQLDTLASAMERLFYQDFSQPRENLAEDIDPILAADGVTVLASGFRIELVQVNDQPGSWIVGASACSLGMGWGLRRMIRTDLRIGTPYVPPVG